MRWPSLLGRCVVFIAAVLMGYLISSSVIAFGLRDRQLHEMSADEKPYVLMEGHGR
jgi:hypothetical protein